MLHQLNTSQELKRIGNITFFKMKYRNYLKLRIQFNLLDSNKMIIKETIIKDHYRMNPSPFASKHSSKRRTFVRHRHFAYNSDKFLLHLATFSNTCGRIHVHILDDMDSLY